MRYYTGIGSRKCPLDILSFMTVIARWLHDKDYILRSGGADGADTAFERGAGKEKEIYLPWKGFNNSTSPLYKISNRAFEVASKIHPAWDRCSLAAKKLHARNVLQIFGKDFGGSPDRHIGSHFVVCWTPNGRKVGGTATAIKLAEGCGIPVFNLAIESHKDKLKRKIKEGQDNLGRLDDPNFSITYFKGD